MAISKSGVLGAVSGRVGGVEFAQSGGRSVVKAKKTRASSWSPDKGIAQQQLRDAIDHWKGLTDAQRKAWGVAASQRPSPDRFGVKRCRSGFQLFLTIPHDFRFGVVERWQDVPPIQGFQLVDVTYQLVTAPSVWMLDYLTAPVETVACIYAYAARFQKATAKCTGRYKKVGMSDCGAGMPIMFDTSLQGLNVAFLPGEVIDVKYQLWGPGYWPLWFDGGRITVEG